VRPNMSEHQARKAARMARTGGRFRARRFLLAAALPVVAMAAVLTAIDQRDLRRQVREARQFELTPVALGTDIAEVIDLPTGAGNAAEHYKSAQQLLDDEQPRYEALVEQLEEIGVTPETRIDFKCLGPVMAGTSQRYCRFADHPARTRAEVDAERARLQGLMAMGRLLAARSRLDALHGRRGRAIDLARRLIVLGWHLTQAPAASRLQPTTTTAPVSPASRPASGERPGPGRLTAGTASVKARIDGLTLVRWGAHALAKLHTEEGDNEAAGRAQVLEKDAGRTSEALAARSRAMRGKRKDAARTSETPAARSRETPGNRFLQARVALEDPDPGFRVLAVVLMSEDIAHRQRPWLIGRSRYDAVKRVIEGLADDPHPDVRAAARHALSRPR